MIDRGWSGARLAAMIDAEARNRGVTLKVLLAPLTRDAGHWIAQMRLAKRPKPATFDRLEALLSGAEVPPPPPNNFQKGCSRLNVVTTAEPAMRPRAPDRSPCPRCAVRADIGCRHRPLPQEVLAS